MICSAFWKFLQFSFSVSSDRRIKEHVYQRIYSISNISRYVQCHLNKKGIVIGNNDGLWRDMIVHEMRNWFFIDIFTPSRFDVILFILNISSNHSLSPPMRIAEICYSPGRRENMFWSWSWPCSNQYFEKNIGRLWENTKILIGRNAKFTWYGINWTLPHRTFLRN